MTQPINVPNEPPNTLTEADKETLAETAKKWRHLGWFQLALVPVILGFLVAGFDVPGASWLILEQFLGVAFVFSVVGPTAPVATASTVPGVLSGSRLAVTALFSFAVLVLLGMIIQILGEPSVSPVHANHLREFAMVYVIETSWASMVVVWRRSLNIHNPDVDKNKQPAYIDHSKQSAPAEIDFSNGPYDWSSGDWSSGPHDWSSGRDSSDERERSKKLAKELIARFGVDGKKK